MNNNFDFGGCDVAVINTQHMVSEIVRRKQWTQVQTLSEGDYSEATLARIMGRTHNPHEHTYEKLMDSLGVPSETLYVPRLFNASPYILSLYETVLFALERAHYHPHALGKAKVLMEELLATGNFNEGINHQYILGCTLWINLLEGIEKTNHIATRALKGIHITYPEFSHERYKGEVLILGEPMLVRIYGNALASYNPAQAIILLQHTMLGIEQTPHDDLLKERILAPLALDLIKILFQKKMFAEALVICDSGNIASIRRNKGKYTPDFIFAKAKILCEMEDVEHASKLLLPVFFGYVALGRYDDAQAVRNFAQSINYDFPTYGAEKIPRYETDFNISRGSHLVAKTPGEFIWFFRTEEGLKQNELCDGICSTSILSKIESNRLTGTVYQLEALMQRLGRHSDYYFSNYLSNETFKGKQMRDEVNTRIVNRQYTQAEELLVELKNHDDFQDKTGMQFVLKSEAILYKARYGYDSKHMQLLMQAWQITKKNITIDTAPRGRLSKTEVTLLNLIASHLCAIGERERGIRLFEGLRHNLLFYYVDELERMRSYILILGNLTADLGRAGRYNKLFELIPEGIILCLKYQNLRLARRFAANNGCALIEAGKKEDAIPFMAMDYYVSGLLGYTKSQESVKKHIQKNMLEINFV